MYFQFINSHEFKENTDENIKTTWKAVECKKWYHVFFWGGYFIFSYFTRFNGLINPFEILSESIYYMKLWI